MPDRFKFSQWPIVMRHLVAAAGLLSVVLSVLLFVGRPHAQSLITKTIEEQGYAKADQLGKLQEQVDRLEEALKATNTEMSVRVGQIQSEIRLLERSQSETAAQIDNIEKLAKEGRDTQRQILLQLNRLQN